MRKRDELSDPNSCMNKARDDEWTFVLLGRDVSAVDAVRAWIESRIRKGKNTRADAKIREAERWIEAVEKEHGASDFKFAPRDVVRRAPGASYTFPGVVLSCFCNTQGRRMYVVEHAFEPGLIHVFREADIDFREDASSPV